MIRLSRRLLSAALACLAVAACDSGGGTDNELNVPTGLTVMATGPRSVTITFTTVAGATGYEVQLAHGAGATFNTIGTPTPPPLSDAGLSPGTAYQYRVAA